MSKLISNMPSQLSEISFNSNDIINVKIGWDFKFSMLEFQPIIHLFYKNGNRIDLVSSKKRSTQGIKLVKYEGSCFDVEVNMKKMPAYVDSIYISLGSVDRSKNVNLLKDLYFQVSQGKSTELWSQTTLSQDSPTIILAAIEKLDQSLVNNNPKPKWTFNFLVNSIPPDLSRIESVITKSDLFHLPEISLTKWEKVKHYFINLLSNIINGLQISKNNIQP